MVDLYLEAVQKDGRRVLAAKREFVAAHNHAFVVDGPDTSAHTKRMAALRMVAAKNDLLRLGIDENEITPEDWYEWRTLR